MRALFPPKKKLHQIPYAIYYGNQSIDQTSAQSIIAFALWYLLFKCFGIATACSRILSHKPENSSTFRYYCTIA
jgi:hypothetical protein